MKVALLQTRFYTGGKSRVAADFIRVLNTFNIVPDLISISDKNDIREFEQRYNLIQNKNFEVKFPFGHKFSKNVRRGVSYQIPLLNITSRSLYSKYDMIINLSNCMYFLPESIAKVHYIHHPPEAVLKYEPKYKQSHVWSLYTTPLKMLYWSQSPPKGDVYLANSNYTKRRMEEFYNIDDQIDVVYPPVVDDFISREAELKKKKVSTLGSFHPNKKQMAQIDIAEKHPDHDFVLMGRVKSKSYFEKCEKRVESNSIDNVRLLPDVETSRLLSELRSSDYFLHTRKNERFGIAVAEAISRGCIPIVHDSGGLEEIVPISDLRFSDISEASNILCRLDKVNTEEKNDLSTYLSNNAKQFTPTEFQKRIKQILREQISCL